MKDLTINLENEPGSAARVAETLGAAGVNIEGAAGMATGDSGVMRVTVADADAARNALSAAGIDCGPETDVEVVSIIDEPGELGRHLRRIGDAGVNVTAMYLATNTRLVVAADDMDGLRRALHG